MSHLQVSKPHSARDTYWGSTQTLVDCHEYCLKRMWMNAGSQSSLEYHATKKETYVIEKGRLRVGVRTGRARNSSVILNPGDTFTILPGQMHMRIAVEDTVILEVSTGDMPGDTHIVEDGKTYTHLEDDE